MTRSAVAQPDGSPASFSLWVSGGFAGLAWSVTLPYSFYGAVIATLAWLLVCVAVFVGDRDVLSIGALGSVIGVFVSTGDGAQLISVLVGVTASVLAWDIGNNAISLGRQLGSDSITFEIELVHAGASTVIGISIVIITSLAFVLFAGIQFRITVVYLLLAAGLVALVFSPKGVLEIEWPG